MEINEIHKWNDNLQTHPSKAISEQKMEPTPLTLHQSGYCRSQHPTVHSTPLFPSLYMICFWAAPQCQPALKKMRGILKNPEE